MTPDIADNTHLLTDEAERAEGPARRQSNIQVNMAALSTPTILNENQAQRLPTLLPNPFTFLYKLVFLDTPAPPPPFAPPYPVERPYSSRLEK